MEVKNGDAVNNLRQSQYRGEPCTRKVVGRARWKARQKPERAQCKELAWGPNTTVSGSIAITTCPFYPASRFKNYQNLNEPPAEKSNGKKVNTVIDGRKLPEQSGSDFSVSAIF